MQITRFGNLLENVKKGFIVHGCNNHGVMGSGFAKELRAMFPQAYEEYAKEYRDNGLLLGTNVIVEVAPDLFIVNAITQNGFGKDGRRYVKYEAIHECMFNVFCNPRLEELTVHYPLIGAGLGGGDWSIIQSVIDSAYHMSGSEAQRFLWLLD